MTGPRYTNIAEITAANKAAGRFWFSADTIAFFNARVESRIYANASGTKRFWVDSIQDKRHPMGPQPREYKIAAFTVATGDIDRVLNTPAFASAREAERYLTDNLLEGATA